MTRTPRTFSDSHAMPVGMYWVFANSQHLTEVIASQVLPVEVVNSEAHFGESTDGEIWVKPLEAIPQTAGRKLKKHYVRAKQKIPVLTGMKAFRWLTLSTWWQFLVPKRVLQVGGNAPDQSALLRVSSGEQLARIIGEILRLGGRLQGVSLPTDPHGTALLMVQDLPYFSMLGVMDQSAANAQRLFLFHNSRVAIEAGFMHPLVEQIAVPENQLLLLNGVGETTVVNQSQFRDLDDRQVLSITSRDPGQFARTEIDPIPVELRLIARPSLEPPSLWVIPLMELQEWVQKTEQRLLEQVAVAVFESSGSTRVVVRPQNAPPPVLLWESVGLCPSRNVPGLFLPWNRDLHPAARAEVLQTVLNWRQDTVTWVSEETSKRFRVECIPESAFRPLMNWVEYELSRSIDHFQAWSPSYRWDFERFQIQEESQRRSDPPQTESIGSENESARNRRATGSVSSGVRKPAKPSIRGPRSSTPVQQNQREARQRLVELQNSFLSTTLSLDAEEHHPAWQELARLHFVLGEADEGMLCLTHALWNGAPSDPAWFESLWSSWRGKEREGARLEELKILIRVRKPTAGELSRLAFLLIGFSIEESAETFPRELMPPLQQFLMRFEHELPVRVAWLAWVSLFQLADGDALSLARARDRFLERLFAKGIRPKRDVPKFLQGGGSGSRKTPPGQNAGLEDFCDVLHGWSQANGNNAANQTGAYLDLVLAFGLARRGETAPAKQILESAGNVLRRTRDPLHQWGLDAFEIRIRQVLSGDDPTSPFPRPLSEAFHEFSKYDQFKLNRLRQDSRILESPQSRDLYRAYRQESQDDLARDLAKLEDLVDSFELTAMFDRIQKTYQQSDAQFRVAVAGLDLAPRMGVTVAERLLQQSAQLLTEDCEVSRALPLLEKSLRVAAHFDREEWVTRFISDLGRLLKSLRDAEPEVGFSLESLVGESVRGMRRFGRRAETIGLLDQMEQWAIAREPFSTKDMNPQLLLLQIAGGRFYFDQNEQAWAILGQVREQLLKGQRSALAQTQLARGYLKSLEFAPGELAMERFWDFFQNVRGISDGYSLNSLLFISQLCVVEAFVFAITGEVNQQDPATRRLLDDEEYCVRRRIHHDLHEALHSPKSDRPGTR